MKAVVIREVGGPEVLKIETLPIPSPTNDEVLIRVKAFGLNRSELFTRQGHSPGVTFPRVLGIEATGVVAKCPGGQFEIGQKVASAMGGLGRDNNGGYAEYTCVKASNTQAIYTNLDWTVLGAAPETLQTAYGSLFKGLQLKSHDRLLIRGGTTSIGLTAAALAKNHGCFVAATTRKSDGLTTKVLQRNGVDEVILDNGNVAEQVQEEKFSKILDLVGTSTMEDSLRCAAKFGIVCMAGIVGECGVMTRAFVLIDNASGNRWTLDNFYPRQAIPNTVYLTTYGGGPVEFSKTPDVTVCSGGRSSRKMMLKRSLVETPLNDLLNLIQVGKLRLQIGKVFHIDEIVKAHETMESNLARGKIVILTE